MRPVTAALTPQIWDMFVRCGDAPLEERFSVFCDQLGGERAMESAAEAGGGLYLLLPIGAWHCPGCKSHTWLLDA